MQVKAALVDPSCSGSGTDRARLDAQLPGGIDGQRLHQRLQRLADIQVGPLTALVLSQHRSLAMTPM